MSDEPIPAPVPDNGTAFAAGVAAAKADQATDDAAEAAAVAEAAEAVATGATERAAKAEDAAWDARAAVAELETRVMGALDEIREGLSAGRVGAKKSEGGSATAPAPERTEEAAEPPAGPATKKKRTGYGSGLWFGRD